ncbi:MAG: sulfatase family protein, partial [Acidimicrobiales bacterium]
VYCQGPLCMPARASFLTERYVKDHGVIENGSEVPVGTPTVVGDLAASGYHTACIGKMHLWIHGRRRGGAGTRDTRDRIEQMNGYGFIEPIETVGKLATVGIGSEYTDYLKDRGLYHTYQEWVAARRYGSGTTAEGQRSRTLPIWTTSSNPVTGDDYIDAWHGRRVVQWLEEYDRDRPFLLWVGFPGPHDPWDAPADYADLYKDIDMPMPASLKRPELPAGGMYREFLDYFLNVHSDSSNLTDPVIAEIRRYYYGDVTVIDEAIGRILSALERKGDLADTWVIYTSDHGEMMGEHRMLTKMVFYEPSVKVPLIIRPPGGCSPRVVTEMIEHLDVAATLRAISHSAGDAAFEGRSLLGWTDGGTGHSRPSIHSENFGIGMVRTKSHKLVFVEKTFEPVQLFDLIEDPNEDANVIERTDQRAARDQLVQEASAFLASGVLERPPGVFERGGRTRSD